MIANGESFLGKSNTPEAIRDELASLSPDDKEYYLLGAASKLRQNVLDTRLSGDESKAIINSPGMRNRLRPLFSSDNSYNQFVNTVTAERSMKEAATPVTGGSKTAGAAAEDTSHGAGNKGVVGGLMAGMALEGTHSPMTFLPYFGYRLGQAGLRWAQQPAPEVNTAMARLMSQTSLPENEAILQGLAPPRTGITNAAAPVVGGIAAPPLYFGWRPRSGIAP
jgi:hypothetical protein